MINNMFNSEYLSIVSTLHDFGELFNEKHKIKINDRYLILFK